ncbi:MAG TPA: zinc ribbon domain-containing protein [Clostridia bacterium]|nr:zinc ribbon domain-containing protein [Clostridia bacterium]
MMYCPNCGNEIRRGAWFCAGCGQTAPPFRARTFRYVALGLAILDIVIFFTRYLNNLVQVLRYAGGSSLMDLYGNPIWIVVSLLPLIATILLIVGLFQKGKGVLAASVIVNLLSVAIVSFGYIAPASLISKALWIMDQAVVAAVWILILTFLFVPKKGLLFGACAVSILALFINSALTASYYTLILRSQMIVIFIGSATVLLPFAATLLGRFAFPGKQPTAHYPNRM